MSLQSLSSAQRRQNCEASRLDRVRSRRPADISPVRPGVEKLYADDVRKSQDYYEEQLQRNV